MGHFEAGLIESMGQVSDYHFGILAAADLLANIPPEDESGVDSDQADKN